MFNSQLWGHCLGSLESHRIIYDSLHTHDNTHFTSHFIYAKQITPNTSHMIPLHKTKKKSQEIITVIILLITQGCYKIVTFVFNSTFPVNFKVFSPIFPINFYELSWHLLCHSITFLLPSCYLPNTFLLLSCYFYIILTITSLYYSSHSTIRTYELTGRWWLAP